MLDPLVSRPILAQADGVMGHHVDHAAAHEGRNPNRRAAIVGEHEECAGKGMMPPCSAIHSWRRPCMFADPIMNVAAAEFAAETTRSLLVLVLLEGVRSAEPPTSSGPPQSTLPAPAPMPCAWRWSAARRPGFRLQTRRRPGPARPAGAPSVRRSNWARRSGSMAARRSRPRLVYARAWPAGRPRASCPARSAWTERLRQRFSLASVLAPASSSAPSGSPWALEVPAGGWARRADRRVAGDQGRAVGLRASSARRASRARGRRGAGRPCPRIGNACIGSARSKAMWGRRWRCRCRPQHVSLLSFRCPASPMASWLTPSIRWPSEAST